MAKKTIAFDYQRKSVDLSNILKRIQASDITIDEATKLYEAGLLLVAELETYLKQAENTVRKHTAESSAA